MKDIRSTLAHRVDHANSYTEDIGKRLWGIAATIALTLVSVNGLAYVVIEYGMFGGKSEYFVPTTVADVDGVKGKTVYEFGMSGTVPTADLNDGQFQVYVGFVMYATMVLTGLGMEYLVWRMFLNDEWDKRTENVWRVAQFVFPILTATALGLANTGNFLAFPFLVVAMWKFGFPGECNVHAFSIKIALYSSGRYIIHHYFVTHFVAARFCMSETILFFYSALYGGREQSFVERLVAFMRGVGTAAHHSASVLYVAMLVVHVLPLANRDAVAVTLPLVMQ
jgi:hypothetical protein